MQINSYPFGKLPFSDLFRAYVEDFDKLSRFYETNPFGLDSIRQAAQSFTFQGNRHESADILRELNQRYQPDKKALQNIDRLEQEEALVVVTGQQLGVLGGPLYTVYKTIGTIHLANKLEGLLNRPVIPVFWLADEDHDYQEVQKLTVIGNNEPQTFSLPDKAGNLPPVAELTYPEDLEKLKNELKGVLYETDFSKELWRLLNASFEQDKRFDYSFGDYMARIFSSHGLVLAGSNHNAVKEHTKNCMLKAIKKADIFRTALQDQTDALKKEYHQQVTLYDSNLFYLNPEKGREKISRNGEGWKTDSGKEWHTAELLDEIDAEPEKYSPNVFLRPVMQDLFLPTIGYVAGPGETAYYGQMKKYYQAFDLKMPIIFPRLSATLVEPAIGRILDELPFEIHEYNKRIEDLESDFVDRTEQVDIEAIFSDWKKKVQKVSESKTDRIVEVDQTLEGAAGSATAVYMGELDKLKGKVYRSVKQQEQTQLNRIRKIKEHLFPNGGLQERSIAGIYFMNKYGIDIWDRLLNVLEEDELFDNHKIISL